MMQKLTDTKHRGIHWSNEEIEIATKSYKDGLSIKEIANKIERTEDSIHKKIKELNLTNRKKNWSETEESELIKLFNEGKSNKYLSEFFNRPLRGIQGHLLKLGLKRREINVWKDNPRNDFWTDTEIDTVKLLIEQGESARDIALKINRSTGVLFNKLSELNLKIKKKSNIQESNYRRYYTLNDNYFEKIDSQMKAYFLGWLMTDGYVGHSINSARGEYKSNRIGMKLSIKDVSILEELRSALETNVPIKYGQARSTEFTNKKTGKKNIISSGMSCALDFSSAKMKEDLKQYGVVNKKTYTIGFPENVPKTFYPGLIAGLISGDGCIDIKKNHQTGRILRISLAANLHLLERIKEILIEEIQYKPKIRKEKTSEKLFILELNQTESINLYSWLKRNNVRIMERKTSILEKFIVEKGYNI
jgi:hypothetical protein